ncbi:MAG: type II secretion system protein GspG [Pseudomonadota bacterium]|nr:type II secretion system protein GspG [Pseudomonadota bacterium]
MRCLFSIALLISSTHLLTACSNSDAQRQQLAQDHVRKLNKASEFFYVEHKKCPESANDLARLFTGKDENSTDFSKDPWGNDFVMYKAHNGKACHFKSLGADGKEGGAGMAADILQADAAG